MLDTVLKGKGALSERVPIFEYMGFMEKKGPAIF